MIEFKEYKDMEEKFLLDKDGVFILEGKIGRKVENINDAKKIIEVLEKKGLLGVHVAETSISENLKNVVEHKIISPMLYSGEFTESMLVDITELSLKIGLELLDYGIYIIDFLPQNCTYYKGEWLLYDFGALSTNSFSVKTQARIMFDVNFSSMELLKKVKRKELKQYFLNLTKVKYLVHMVPIRTFLYFCMRKRWGLILYYLKRYKQCYEYLNRVTQSYKKRIQRYVYDYELNGFDKEETEIIDGILTDNNILTSFDVGETAGRCAMESKIHVNHFVYLDDYELCDRYYNLLREKQKKNIGTAVIFPYLKDKEINEDYSFRALYDDFNVERFYSDSVIALDLSKVFALEEQNTEEFLKNLSKFGEKVCILRYKKEDEEKISYGQLTAILRKLFRKIKNRELSNGDVLLICSEKFEDSTPVLFYYTSQYKNKNRRAFCEIEAEEIIKILKKAGK